MSIIKDTINYCYSFRAIFHNATKIILRSVLVTLSVLLIYIATRIIHRTFIFELRIKVTVSQNTARLKSFLHIIKIYIYIYIKDKDSVLFLAYKRNKKRQKNIIVKTAVVTREDRSGERA